MAAYRVYNPSVRGHPEPTSMPAEQAPTPADILAVDDHPANLLALEAVLDRHMPGLNGFETAQRVRARERSRDTPVIFVTAALDTDFPVPEAYKLGAVDYLVKPLNPDVLRAKVGVFVDLFRKAERVRQL